MGIFCIVQLRILCTKRSQKAMFCRWKFDAGRIIFASRNRKFAYLYPGPRRFGKTVMANMVVCFSRGVRL